MGKCYDSQNIFGGGILILNLSGLHKVYIKNYRNIKNNERVITRLLQ